MEEGEVSQELEPQEKQQLLEPPLEVEMGGKGNMNILNSLTSNPQISLQSFPLATANQEPNDLEDKKAQPTYILPLECRIYN
jgi:hypothetical protein